MVCTYRYSADVTKLDALPVLLQNAHMDAEGFQVTKGGSTTTAASSQGKARDKLLQPQQGT
jgi:hypothetical protein